ncbi:prephenate dehydrogenase [Neorhodopirellula lusitana]|uniref:prephenate dehydrogenase n=1 Tax=Neorhodopirellula lusitana TaxID=445327 RepID=UPI00384BBAB0
MSMTKFPGTPGEDPPPRWEEARRSDILSFVSTSPQEPLSRTPTSPPSVAIVGLGLLGGSVALALKQTHPDIRIVGCARREETRQFAIENGVVDSATDDLIAACSDVDIVVIATPVDQIADTAVTIGRACPRVVMTDVGSTKLGITQAVAEHPEIAARFVAAHPIAGSEKTGIQNSRADLFQGRPIVITPLEIATPSDSPAADSGVIQTIEEFWRATGGHVTRMTPQRHDELLAISSHMPHLMASLIAGQLPDEARPLAGTGWLSTTRIAAGDPGLWTAIVAENRSAIVAALKSTQAELDVLIQRIENHEDDAVRDWLTVAQTTRQNTPSSQSTASSSAGG